MTNATAMAMVSHLDSLVLDYVQRRPKSSVAETSPFHTPDGTVTKFPPVGDLTLEHIYFFYFSHNPLFVEATPSEKLDSKPANLVFPRLPSEVVEQIFESCEVKQLFPLRMLNRRLNKMISERICRQAAKIVKLQKHKSTVRFAKYFARKKKIQGLGSIFGSYYFEGPYDSVLEVLPTLGPQLRFARFEATSFGVEFLAQIPNVENLNFISLPDVSGYEVSECNQLTKLKYLTLTSDWSARGHVTMEYLSFWANLAPNLRELHIGIYSSTEPTPQLLQLFRSNRYLNNITCRQHSISRKNGKMEVKQIRYCTSSEIINLYESLASPLSKPPSLLPPLRHVTLTGANSSYFNNFVFDSVSCLSLFDENWERWSEMYPPQYHINFPQLDTLHLMGNLYVKNVKCFASTFGAIPNLKFSEFDRNTASATSIFDVEVTTAPGQSKWVAEWPISKFKGLKTLEFEGKKCLRRTVLDVVRLTLQQLMQPLEQLTITHFSPGNEELVEERKLFYSMRQLQYHKQLNFEITHSANANYKEPKYVMCNL